MAARWDTDCPFCGEVDHPGPCTRTDYPELKGIGSFIITADDGIHVEADSIDEFNQYLAEIGLPILDLD